ncbi:carbohydrate kinase family protein [Streptomyces inhibens]|uniref:carbohydrate kinase family protein n=1 Tax=Streptomyces inhibens TaxID=2293571 RepID=UPI00402ABD64
MITVVGEALVDLVQAAEAPFAPTEHPGGSPANVATALARLEAPVTLITQLGEDRLGRLVREHLVASGVRLQLTPGAAGATSTAVATLDRSGGARYDFRIRWDLPAPPAIPGGSRCLHTGSIATGLDPGAEAVEELLAREREAGTVTISLDPNVRPALLGSRDQARERIERQVALADVVKVSEEDLDWLHPSHSPVDLARHWQRSGPAVVVVTLGGAGSVAVTRTGTTYRPAPPVTVADTVGAGDAFTAGLLHWLGLAGLLGGDRRDALRALGSGDACRMLDAAARVAAFTCTRPGADPPTLRELLAFRPQGRLATA